MASLPKETLNKESFIKGVHSVVLLVKNVHKGSFIFPLLLYFYSFRVYYLYMISVMMCFLLSFKVIFHIFFKKVT